MTDTNTIEKRIVRKLVKVALDAGYTVSVNDGEEWAIKRSTSLKAIMEAVMSTDSDTLVFRQNGERIGSVLLIYGNGNDVISDHTDTDTVNALVAPVLAYAEAQA